MLSVFPSADLDLAGFDTPAFPLDFNPELLLNDESTADDFHNWLQSELDILQDSPKAATDDVATEQFSAPTSGVSGEDGSTGQQLTGSTGTQAAPGIVELFQLQALAPGPNASQQMPWMEQQLLMQPHQQQQVMPQNHQLALAQQLQQGTQASAAATAGMQLAMPQQHLQLQQQANGTDMLYLSQPYAVQEQQYMQQLQPGLQQQYMYMPQPVIQQQQQPGSFVVPSAPASQSMMWQPMHQVMQPMQPYSQALLPDGSYAGMMLPPSWTAGMPGALASAAAAPAGSGSYDMQPSNGFLQVPSASLQQMHSGQLLSPTGSSYQAAPSVAAAAGAANVQAQQQQHSRGGSAQKTRSKANGTAAAAAAAAAVAGGTEKVKAPSRRFRERQKDTISSLEAEVIEKLAQLQALSAENEMLKLRSSVLEATVKGREYHMKVIKEHGPPVFDASELAHDVLTAAMQQQQRPCSTTTNYSGASGSCMSGSARTANVNAHSSPSDTDGEDTPSGDASGDCGLSNCHSGVSHTSTATGSAAAACAAAAAAAAAAVEVKHEPVNHEAATTVAAAAVVAAATAAGKSEGEEDCGGLACCDAPQKCTAAQQKKTISSLKHMTTDEIIRHWKQFVHDVTGELLAAEQEQQQQQQAACAAQSHGSDATAAGAAAFDSSDPGSATTSAAASAAKTCQWEKHSAEVCEEQQRRQQQQDQCDGMAARHESGCGKDPAVEESCGANQSASARRILALVNRYSYMSKFVALLNPGVLYHLYGRHLDTGLAAPYSDDHWRQVVSRLGLNKHQVTVILACAELYFSSMNTLLEQRRDLQQQLKQADEGLSECQRRLLGVDGGLNQLQVLDSLASNLKREHVLRIMLNCFVWGRSLNSIQFAKSAVYSYPFFPDVHAMVCVLYEDARAMAPNGRPALVFPHRQSSSTVASHEQQQPQLQALHERLRNESDSLRVEAEAQQQQQQLQLQLQLRDAQGMQYTGSMQSAGLGDLDLEAVLAA